MITEEVFDRPHIAVVIVVYNIKISNSISYQKLRTTDYYNNLHLIIVDNSEMESDNEHFCNDIKVDYINMHGNKGLSKAYNAAVNRAIMDDAIVLMDDDTEITNEYFIELYKSMKDYPEVDVFAPIVYGQDGRIYSPNEYGFLRNHFISNPRQSIRKNLFNAIASCLAIRMRVFANYRFNEYLFMDQVDQNFFNDMRKQERLFQILPVYIHQNFYQRGDRLNSDDAWKRLSLRIKDIIRQGKMYGKGYPLLSWIKCLGLGVQIGKKSMSVMVILRAWILCTIMLFKPE